MFHDCGTWDLDQGETGGCDGSFILAEEFNRRENDGMQDIAGKLKDIAEKFSVGVADLMVFAASVAVATCPLGPVVRSNKLTISFIKPRLIKDPSSLFRQQPLSVVRTRPTRPL